MEDSTTFVSLVACVCCAAQKEAMVGLGTVEVVLASLFWYHSSSAAAVLGRGVHPSFLGSAHKRADRSHGRDSCGCAVCDV